MTVQIFWHVQIMLQPFKNLDQCQSLKLLMLELHTAKLDSLCADGTKLSKKKQYLGQTTFEHSSGISVSIQRYVKQCFFQLVPVDPVGNIQK